MISTKCKNCGREIEISEQRHKRSKTKHFFCSLSCAATYNNKHRKRRTQESRGRTSKSLKNYHNTHKKDKRELKHYTCKVCGKEYVLDDGLSRVFCSAECKETYNKNKDKYIDKEKLREAGLKSSQSQTETRRSRNEIEFYDLCKQHFRDVAHNEQIFNGWDADVIIHDIRYAVLWNGVWHYKQIKRGQSLSQIQTRDEIKLSEIRKCGYTPYVIKDMGKHDKNFVKEEFDRFLKNIS